MKLGNVSVKYLFASFLMNALIRCAAARRSLELLIGGILMRPFLRKADGRPHCATLAPPLSLSLPSASL